MNNWFDIQLYLDDNFINNTKQYYQLPLTTSIYRTHLNVVKNIFRNHIKTRTIFDRISYAKRTVMNRIGKLKIEWKEKNYLNENVEFLNKFFDIQEILARLSKTTFKSFTNCIDLYQSYYIHSWYNNYYLGNELYELNAGSIEYWEQFKIDIMNELDKDNLIQTIINNLGYELDLYPKLKESLFDEWNNIYFYQKFDTIDFNFLKSIVNVYNGTNVLESIESIDRILPEYDIGKRIKTINIEDFLSNLLSTIANINIDSQLIIDNNFKICDEDITVCKTDVVLSSKYILNYCLDIDSQLQNQDLFDIPEGDKHRTITTRETFEYDIGKIINETYRGLVCKGKNLPNYFIFNIDNYKDLNDSERVLVKIRANKLEKIKIRNQIYELISCSIFKPNPNSKIPHYISCIKNQSIWYLLDDDIAEIIDDKEILKEGTLFVYKKKNILVPEFNIQRLKNLNKTCYVNAALQLLMPTNVYSLLSSMINQIDISIEYIESELFRKKITTYMKKYNIDDILSHRPDLRQITYEYIKDKNFMYVIDTYPYILNSFEFVDTLRINIQQTLNLNVNDYDRLRQEIKKELVKYEIQVEIDNAKKKIIKQFDIIRKRWKNKQEGDFTDSIGEGDMENIIDRISLQKYKFWYNMIDYITDSLLYEHVTLEKSIEDTYATISKNADRINRKIVKTNRYDELVNEVYNEWDILKNNELITTDIITDSVIESLINLYRGKYIMESIHNVMRISSEYRGLKNIISRELNISNFLTTLFDVLKYSANKMYREIPKNFTIIQNDFTQRYEQYLDAQNFTGTTLLEQFTDNDILRLYDTSIKSRIRNDKQLIDKISLNKIFQKNYVFQLIKYDTIDIQSIISKMKNIEKRNYVILDIKNHIFYDNKFIVRYEGPRDNYNRIKIGDEQYELISFNNNLFYENSIIGHSTACIKLDNQWYCIDDDNSLVRLESIEDNIKLAQFYIYKKINFIPDFTTPDPVRIRNFNNTCYLNSLIQLLFPTAFFPLLERYSGEIVQPMIQ